MDEKLRSMDVVLFDEGDVPPEAVVFRHGIDLVNEVLAGFVGRVGLACENDLDRPPGVLEQTLEPLQVLEQQRRALVGREAPRESNGQGLRRQ